MNPGLEVLVAGMTVGELAARAGTTVEALIGAVFSSRSPTPKNFTKAKPTKKPAAEPTKKTGSVARGGLQPAQVLAALASVKSPAKLEDVREKTGGTVPQVRAALQKLAQQKKVVITGQRRGTRYAVK